MRPRTLLALLAVLVTAAVCVRLGFWQLARLREKQTLNAGLAAARRAPPLIVEGELPPPSTARHRMIELRGTFDESRQFLLTGRAHSGAPGVEIVTPLRVRGTGAAVLVNRGWLPAPDAATARPQEFPEPGERVVRGFVEDLRHGAGGAPLRRRGDDRATLWSARWLDADSVRARLPYPVAEYVVRQTPAPGVAERPLRSEPRPYNEATHVSYAMQWFLFAAILLGGSATLAWSRRRRTTPHAPEIPS